MSSVRCAALFVALLLFMTVSPLLATPPSAPSAVTLESESQPRGSSDAWNETPFRDVAVPEGFTFLSYTDYSDVGVLINNKSAMSRTIGWAFVNARNITPERVFLFDEDGTPGGETINNQQFDDYYADPLRQMISDRNLTNELNYLVTTKGIPLRVSGGTNARASFDSEIGLLNGLYNGSIHQNWWTQHTYGPGSNNVMEEFSRERYGFYLVTRLTGYSVDTALGLIEKANNSFGSRGQAVLDLATNRNGSGYKWWNDMLYYANTTLSGWMGQPVHFNQNSTFVTNQSNVMFYASWGSNDGAWNGGWGSNVGFETAGATSTGALSWSGTGPSVTALGPGASWSWERQNEIDRNGNWALEGKLTTTCTNQTVGSGNNTTIVEVCDPPADPANISASISQDWTLTEGLSGHAWLVYIYGHRTGQLNGTMRLVVEGFDANGSLVSTNISNTRTLSSSWNYVPTMRFRPAANATSFTVRMDYQSHATTVNGSLYLDTFNLRAIRPHFDWVDGSIAETAVSTGGRTFNWGAGYGQSLVADLLEDGVSGVKGYVYEPYLSAVSYPHILHPYYAYGYNLAEVYYASNPLISWMGTVVGDPKMAAYSDILHDINVSAVRTNGTLSIGVNGSIEVLLENVGPGAALGYLEVRDRVGGALLANVSLTLPAGDEIGSRTILSVNLTPTRVGFNEFVVRYVAGNWTSPERIVDNNLGILNLQVNEPPVVEEFVCSTLVAARGDVVGCTTEVSDDFGVVRARLAWRMNGSGDAWTFVEGASTDSVEWYASLSVPTNISVGTLDLLAEVRDGQGLVDLHEVANGLQVVDATATWHGIHIAGIDENDWSGASPLSNPALSGIERGVEQILTACVVDPDHDPTVEIPVFIATRGEVSAAVLVNGSDPLLQCYTATWLLDWGSPLQSAELHLYDHLGALWNTRSIPVDDIPWEAELSLIDPSGIEQQFARGLGEWVRITMSDADDPLTGHFGRLTTTWPGHVPKVTDVVLEAADNGSIEFRLPLADGMLVPGDLELSLTLTDDGLTGLTRDFQASWLLHMQPPEVLGIGLCDEGSLELTRGVTKRGWVSLDRHRMLEGVSFTLAQAGTIVPMTSSPVDWPDCQFPDTAHLMWGFEVTVDNRFSDGDATLLAIATDVDSLRGTNEWTFEIAYGQPTIDVSALPVEVTPGEATRLEMGVDDPDGHEGTHCVVLVRDDNASIVLRSETPPNTAGELSPTWWPPAEGAPFILTVGCTDAHDNQAVASSLEISLSDSEQEPEEEGPTSSTEESDLTSVAIIVGGLMLLVFVAALGSVLIWRRNSAFGEGVQQVLEEEVAWAAPEDSYTEGVQSVKLQQMAQDPTGEGEATLPSEQPAETPAQEQDELESILDDFLEGSD